MHKTNYIKQLVLDHFTKNRIEIARAKHYYKSWGQWEDNKEHFVRECLARFIDKKILYEYTYNELMMMGRYALKSLGLL